MTRLKLFIFSLLLSISAFSADRNAVEPGYTINFENVQAKEVLQFLSKVANLNLIFNESDLSFTISFVSDREASLTDIKSAVIQILRIHGLSMIEDGGNLIIHKNPGVKQIPTVVSSENPYKGEMPPIITRVFKIHRGNPTNIAALLTPLLSTTAIIEVSADTRQIIVTDVTSSIETVQQLLKSLDSPESSYDIDSYTATHTSGLELQILVQKIMDPIREGTTLDIVVQPNTNTLYIVSTPFLIDKTISILEELDRDLGILKTSGKHKLSSTNILMYQLKNRSEKMVINIIHQIIKESKQQGLNVDELEKIVDNALYIKATHSLAFIGLPHNLALINGLLENIDTGHSILGSDEASFFLFEPKGMSVDNMQKVLDEIAQNLKNSGYPNRPLIEVLQHASPIYPLNAILFVGNPESLEELQQILPSFDNNSSVSHELLTHAPPSTEFLVFTPENTDAYELKSMILETAAKLNMSKLSDPAFMNCLESVKILESTKQLLFTGNIESLSRLRILLEQLDLQGHDDKEETMIFIYEPKSLSYKELKITLEGIVKDAESFQHAAYFPLSKTIESMREVKNSSTVQFVGTEASIIKLKAILTQIDHDHDIKNAFGTNILVYKVKASAPNELIKELKFIAGETKKLSNKNTPFYNAVYSVRYIKNSHSLVFVGAEKSLAKIHKILDGFEAGITAKKETAKKGAPEEKRIVEGYQIYVPQYIPGLELIQMVSSFENHLVNSGMINKGLAEVVDHLSYVQKTHTIIVSGEKSAVTEVIGLLKQFDTLETLEATGGSTEADVETITDQGFLLYKIQNISGSEIVNALNKISSNLTAKNKNAAQHQELIQAISSVQWIETTNSLIANGVPNILTKLDQLLKSIDRPLAQVFIEVLVIDTSLSDELTFGLSWQNKGTIDEKLGYAVGNFTPQTDSPGIPLANNFNQIDGSTTPSAKAIPPLAGGYLGIIGDVIFHNGKSYSSIGSLLNALKTKGDTTVVLSQKIVTQDNQNAKIFSGSNIPFTGSLVTTSGLSQTTNANLEYRNIGVTLSITPNISDDGMITLDINEEISSESGTGNNNNTQVDARNINGIRTAKTNMMTKIRVPDRHFLILSGTMRNQVVRNVSGIPCLGGLPLIGAAFNKTEKSFDNRNVIMFVKPHIINNTQQHAEITAAQEKLYSQPDQTNPEDFDNGIELVRSASDFDGYDDFEEDDFDFDDEYE